MSATQIDWRKSSSDVTSSPVKSVTIVHKNDVAPPEGSSAASSDQGESGIETVSGSGSSIEVVRNLDDLPPETESVAPAAMSTAVSTVVSTVPNSTTVEVVNDGDNLSTPSATVEEARSVGGQGSVFDESFLQTLPRDDDAVDPSLESNRSIKKVAVVGGVAIFLIAVAFACKELGLLQKLGSLLAGVPGFKTFGLWLESLSSLKSKKKDDCAVEFNGRLYTKGECIHLVNKLMSLALNGCEAKIIRRDFYALPLLTLEGRLTPVTLVRLTGGLSSDQRGMYCEALIYDPTDPSAIGEDGLTPAQVSVDAMGRSSEWYG